MHYVSCEERESDNDIIGLGGAYWLSVQSAEYSRGPKKGRGMGLLYGENCVILASTVFWPTVLSVEPMVQYVVCLSVCL